MSRKKKKGILGALTKTQDTTGQLGGSAIETGKDLVIGLVGSRVLGAVIGGVTDKPAPVFLLGLGLNYAGNYTEQKWLRPLGLGLMAYPVHKSGTVNGLGGTGTDRIKQRLLAFKDEMAEKLFLDKFLKKTPSVAAKSVSGLGGLGYFTFPDEEVGEVGTTMDMSELDRIEMQVLQSGNNYGVSSAVSGYEDPYEEVEEILSPQIIY